MHPFSFESLTLAASQKSLNVGFQRKKNLSAESSNRFLMAFNYEASVDEDGRKVLIRTKSIRLASDLIRWKHDSDEVMVARLEPLRL